MTTPREHLKRLVTRGCPASSADATATLEDLRALGKFRLTTAADVYQLHERLCFLRAYPGDPRILAETERQLEGFSRRPDLRRHRVALGDSGIAGTAIHYRFYWEMARWLVRRWPSRLHLDWSRPEFSERLAASLPVLVTRAEAAWLRAGHNPVRAALEHLCGGEMTDAAFLVRRIEAMPGNTFTREAFHDAIDAAYVLRPGEDTPCRSRARAAHRLPLSWAAPAPGRPDLGRALRQKPRAVRPATPAVAERLIDLAREAMATRGRDLDAFSYADRHDVRLVDEEGGLTLVVYGVVPERRQLLPATYAMLLVRNGVPVGYAQADALSGGAEVAFNTFPTFRGGEAAHLFARVLASVHHLLGARSFRIEPYQLGHGNDEALDSGAWWFYRKLGFAPREPGAVTLAAAEADVIRRDPRHRSSRGTLRRLARAYVFFTADREPVWHPRFGSAAATATEVLAGIGDADRESALLACAAEAARRVGLRSLRGWTPSEQQAWEQWSPLLVAIPDLGHWPKAARLGVIDVVRAKGGRRESDFVARFDAHHRLRAALLPAGGA